MPAISRRRLVGSIVLPPASRARQPHATRFKEQGGLFIRLFSLVWRFARHHPRAPFARPARMRNDLGKPHRSCG
jgi:hypothetical protein